MSYNPTLKPENASVPLEGRVRELKIQFPRRITSMHQIEVTSRCNLKCHYCIHGHHKDGHRGNKPYGPMPRGHGDMDRPTFERALEWVRHYVGAGTQKQLNLAGTGESTLHPELPEFLRLAREAVGDDVEITFATNGVGYGEELVEKLAPFKPAVYVSLHRPEKAGLALRAWERAGCLKGISNDPATNANDWAGQVDWYNSTRFRLPCQWLRQGLAFVCSDGSITTCCLDGDGAGVVGHVRNPIDSVRLAPYKLCGSCHQEIAVEGHDQWGASGEPGRYFLPVVK